jgi:acyl-CoA thioester hydrolase
MRRADNDQYAHVNNAAAYALFDSVVNTFLIARCGHSPTSSTSIGLVVSSHATYFAPLSFPARLDVGLRVVGLGTRSVTYEISVFDEGKEHPAIVGGYTHVFVDRETRRSVPVGSALRAGLDRILAPGGGSGAKL